MEQLQREIFDYVIYLVVYWNAMSAKDEMTVYLSRKVNWC